MLSRTRAALLALAGLLYPLVILAVVSRLAAIDWPARPVLDPQETRIAAVVLAVVSCFNLATPWQRRANWLAFAHSRDQEPALHLVLTGFPFNAAPASYSLVLYVLAASRAYTTPFALASVVAFAAWGALALRASEGA